MATPHRNSPERKLMLKTRRVTQARRDLVIGIQGARFTPFARRKRNHTKRTHGERRAYIADAITQWIRHGLKRDAI